jgi:hypothetical protein
MSESIIDMLSPYARIDSSRKKPFLMTRVGSVPTASTFGVLHIFIFGKLTVHVVRGLNSVTVHPLLCGPMWLCCRILMYATTGMKLLINNRYAAPQYLLDLEHRNARDRASFVMWSWVTLLMILIYATMGMNLRINNRYAEPQYLLDLEHRNASRNSQPVVYGFE